MRQLLSVAEKLPGSRALLTDFSGKFAKHYQKKHINHYQSGFKCYYYKNLPKITLKRGIYVD